VLLGGRVSCSTVQGVLIVQRKLTEFVYLSAPFLISFATLAFLAAPTFESVASRWLKFDESYRNGNR
jgi:hypothetical protein